VRRLYTFKRITARAKKAKKERKKKGVLKILIRLLCLGG
jgi:hypothetical protein